MPRVVPSDVVATIDRMFPWVTERPTEALQVDPSLLLRLAVLVDLVEAVPDELIRLERHWYVAFAAGLSCLRAAPGLFHGDRRSGLLALPGFDQNPIALIRAAMAECRDEAPASDTVGLPFITDPELRESIRLDISAANRGLAEGEWKASTVLGGSAVEALLLWALQQGEARTEGVRANAIAAVMSAGTLTRRPDNNVERWDLHEYVEIAAHLRLITADTATAVRLSRRFRDLIHPGRAQRLGQRCDRSTALAALAAVEAVARDLSR